MALMYDPDLPVKLHSCGVCGKPHPAEQGPICLNCLQKGEYDSLLCGCIIGTANRKRVITRCKMHKKGKDKIWRPNPIPPERAEETQLDETQVDPATGRGWGVSRSGTPGGIGGYGGLRVLENAGEYYYLALAGAGHAPYLGTGWEQAGEVAVYKTQKVRDQHVIIALYQIMTTLVPDLRIRIRTRPENITTGTVHPQTGGLAGITMTHIPTTNWTFATVTDGWTTTGITATQHE